MEIIDFNPHPIRRRLLAEANAKVKKYSESGHDQTVSNDQDDRARPAADLGDGKVAPGDKQTLTLDPKCDEQEDRSRIVTDGPFQLPRWIPMEVAMNCNLPYTSYEIPIPLDLNMDFCIDVMMGQDTIVFMFVCATHSVTVLLEADLGGDTGQ